MSKQKMMRAKVPTKVPMIYIGKDHQQIISRAKKTEAELSTFDNIEAVFVMKVAIEYKKDPSGYNQMIKDIGSNPLSAAKHIAKLKAIFSNGDDE